MNNCKATKILYVVLFFSCVSNSYFNIVVNTELIKQLVECILLKNYEQLINLVCFCFSCILPINIVLQAMITGMVFYIKKKQTYFLENSFLEQYIKQQEWSNHKSEILAKVINDIPRLIEIKNDVILSGISAISTLIFGFLYSMYINWTCSLSSIFIIGFIYWLLRKDIYKLSALEKDLGERHNKNYSYVRNIINNMEIDSFLNVKRILRSFDANTDEIVKVAKKKSKVYAKITLGKNISNTVIILIVSIFCIICQVINFNEISIADALALFMLIPQMVSCFGRFLDVFSNYKIYIGIKERVNQIFNHKEYETKRKISINYINKISFENMSFFYGEKKVLHNINFCINKGDFVMISADSGRGKSTLLKIVLGLLENYSGNVKINDIEKRDIDRKSIWELCSYIGQTNLMLSTSIKNNVLLKNNYEEEKFRDIIKLVGLEALIYKLSQKEETDVGKINLSSGERQKLVIARALYKSNIKLLIMDEATSALDPMAEHEIMNKIKLYVKRNNITCIFVSHSDFLKNIADYVICI